MSITEERLGNAVIRRPIKKGYSLNVLINLLYIQSLRIKSIIESLKGYQLLREKGYCTYLTTDKLHVRLKMIDIQSFSTDI
jgi:hypothetical protein